MLDRLTPKSVTIWFSDGIFSPTFHAPDSIFSFRYSIT